MLRQEIQGGQILARVHYTRTLPRNGMGKVMRQAAREQALLRAGMTSSDPMS
jgi:acyl-coenzyme A synthetase/AMP-(fatty) acid ligase